MGAGSWGIGTATGDPIPAHDAVAAMQRLVGNRTATSIIGSAATQRTLVQRTAWLWLNGAWVAQGATFGQAPPARAGRYEGDYENDGITGPPPIDYVYDAHGDKHFKGQDSQWDNDRATVNALLEEDIAAVEDTIRTNLNPNAAGVTNFYLQVTAAKNIGQLKNKGGPTATYFVQVDYDPANNTISYHGYPDNPNQVDGLRHTKYGALIQ